LRFSVGLFVVKLGIFIDAGADLVRSLAKWIRFNTRGAVVPLGG
jgi:hypothetical protein